MKGFTIIEIIVVVAIFTTLMSIGYVRATDIQRRAPLTATVDVFISDLRGLQTKAMTGSNEANYILSIPAQSLPANITMTTTFPGSKITFAPRSGDIVEGPGTVTLTQTLSGETKVITINRYGAVTQVQ